MPTVRRCESRLRRCVRNATGNPVSYGRCQATWRQSGSPTLTKELAAARHDYAALLDASQVLTRRCEGLETRVAELEATNKRLVDMVWGRRSERRKDSPGQLPLEFSGEPLEPLSPEQQEVIARDAGGRSVRPGTARTSGSSPQSPARETCPERIVPAALGAARPHHRLAGRSQGGAQAAGNQGHGASVFREADGLRRRHPPLRIREAGEPEEGVKSEPAPLAIVEGCKYDFSIIAAMLG